jgi:hypothetical protein
VNPLVLPPRLALRALDDLHAIAEAGVSERLGRVADRLPGARRTHG